MLRFVANFTQVYVFFILLPFHLESFFFKRYFFGIVRFFNLEKSVHPCSPAVDTVCTPDSLWFFCLWPCPNQPAQSGNQLEDRSNPIIDTAICALCSAVVQMTMSYATRITKQLRLTKRLCLILTKSHKRNVVRQTQNLPWRPLIYRRSTEFCIGNSDFVAQKSQLQAFIVQINSTSRCATQGCEGLLEAACPHVWLWGFN